MASDWLWDGDRLVGEYNSSGTLTARYLHGTGPDEPLAQMAGTRRWFLADTQGSIIAETYSAGARVGSAITYDPYGQPGSWTGPRFGYTGQMRLTATVPLWHYKARAYDPKIGRFLQTDPIGYEDSLNLYAYVGNDPVNLADPTGMAAQDRPPTGGLRPADSPFRQSQGTSQSYPQTAAEAGLRPAAPPPPLRPAESAFTSQVYDPSQVQVTGGTTTVGITLQGTYGPGSYQVSVGIALDTNGEFGLYKTDGVGLAAGAGGSAGVSIMHYNVPLSNVRGYGLEMNGGGGAVAGGTLDGALVIDDYGRVTGVGAGGTFGLAGGATNYVGPTYTKTRTLFDITPRE